MSYQIISGTFIFRHDATGVYSHDADYSLEAALERLNADGHRLITLEILPQPNASAPFLYKWFLVYEEFKMVTFKSEPAGPELSEEIADSWKKAYERHFGISWDEAVRRARKKDNHDIF